MAFSKFTINEATQRISTALTCVFHKQDPHSVRPKFNKVELNLDDAAKINSIVSRCLQGSSVVVNPVGYYFDNPDDESASTGYRVELFFGSADEASAILDGGDIGKKKGIVGMHCFKGTYSSSRYRIKFWPTLLTADSESDDDMPIVAEETKEKEMEDNGEIEVVAEETKEGEIEAKEAGVERVDDELIAIERQIELAMTRKRQLEEMKALQAVNESNVELEEVSHTMVCI